MSDFKLLNYQGSDGAARAGILVNGNIVDLRTALPDVAWSVSTLAALNAWEDALLVLHALADKPRGLLIPLTSAKLLAPTGASVKCRINKAFRWTRFGILA